MVMEPGQASIWTDLDVSPTQSSTFQWTPGNPPRLDLTTVRADNTTLHSSAIYAVRGDTLVYCVAAPGYATPTAFATHPNDGCTLVTLKRRQ